MTEYNIRKGTFFFSWKTYGAIKNKLVTFPLLWLKIDGSWYDFIMFYTQEIPWQYSGLAWKAVLRSTFPCSINMKACRDNQHTFNIHSQMFVLSLW